MSKDGHINFEDLNFQYGESMTPGSLFMFSDEENEFRQEIREYAKNEIDPYVVQIDRLKKFFLRFISYPNQSLKHQLSSQLISSTSLLTLNITILSLSKTSVKYPDFLSQL